MYRYISSSKRPSIPLANPDLKRELKKQLLSMSARSFEFFAGDFLVYVGLEAVSVTRFVGDGGIDASGDLVAGMFRIPTGIQVKRHRNNVQRPDIDKFIGALSGRFSQGMFMTTADYAPAALKKASASVPRVLTLNGEQVISVMIEHSLGLRTLPNNPEKLDINPDYFTSFEAMKGLLSHQINESREKYGLAPSPYGSDITTDEQTIELKPEEDLISLNALAYALRVDPTSIRRWVENERLQPDVSQAAGERSSYYFRRDRIEHIRMSLGLENIPTSSDEWKQEFLDFAKSRNLTKSYKPVMLKVFFNLIDREGKVKIDELVKEFRDYYVQRVNSGKPLEVGNSPLTNPMKPSDNAIKRLIVIYPLDRFLIKNFMEYFPEEGILRIAPQLWQELRYYEVIDALKSAEEQINYYYSRLRKDETSSQNTPPT
jgi:hypothetical protein